MPPPRKQPQDRKPPQDATEQFVWFSKSGVQIILPPVGSIPAGLWRKVRRMDDLDATFTMLEGVLDEEALAVLDALSLDELDDMSTQWLATAQASRGESQSSST